MNAVEKKENEVKERREYLNALIASRLPKAEMMSRLEGEKKTAAARGDQEEYRRLFERLSDLNFEKEKLDVSIETATVELRQCQNNLKALKGDFDNRLQAFLNGKEKERIERVNESLESRFEKWRGHFMEVCYEMGELVKECSRFAGPEEQGTTVCSLKQSDFFKNFCEELERRTIKEEPIILPQMWSWPVKIHPYLRSSETLKDFRAALKLSITEREARLKKEFYEKEEEK
jgi:hypothetical protein